MLDDPFVAALPINHPLATQASICAADFDAIPFISYPKDSRSTFGQQMLSLLRSAGAKPVAGYQAIEIHTALALIQNFPVEVVSNNIAYSGFRKNIPVPTRNGSAPIIMADAFASDDSA